RLSQIQLLIANQQVNQLVNQFRRQIVIQHQQVTQIVHRQVVRFLLQILTVHQHQTVVRRVTQMRVIQQVARFRHLSQIPLLIANQLVSQSRRQIVTQHQ
ncbi:hypothetical protein EFE19_08680, partial [Pediococcus pentosaceus]|nr:hypothetical protein [Pediococcus pentosaceus]